MNTATARAQEPAEKPASVWTAIAALVVTLLLALIALSAQAGALEQRVRTLEAQALTNSQKLDRIADSIARVETKLEPRERSR